jgi:hypothetical protein
MPAAHQQPLLVAMQAQAQGEPSKGARAQPLLVAFHRQPLLLAMQAQAQGGATAASSICSCRRQQGRQPLLVAMQEKAKGEEKGLAPVLVGMLRKGKRPRPSPTKAPLLLLPPLSPAALLPLCPSAQPRLPCCLSLCLCGCIPKSTGCPVALSAQARVPCCLCLHSQKHRLVVSRPIAKGQGNSCTGTFACGYLCL